MEFLEVQKPNEVFKEAKEFWMYCILKNIMQRLESFVFFFQIWHARKPKAQGTLEHYISSCSSVELGRPLMC